MSAATSLRISPKQINVQQRFIPFLILPAVVASRKSPVYLLAHMKYGYVFSLHLSMAQALLLAKLTQVV